MEVGGQQHASTALPPAKKTARCEYEVRQAPEQVWTICRTENCLVTGGIRSLARPARSPVTTPTTLSRNLWKHRTYLHKYEFNKMYCSLRHATEGRTLKIWGFPGGVQPYCDLVC